MSKKEKENEKEHRNVGNTALIIGILAIMIAGTAYFAAGASVTIPTTTGLPSRVVRLDENSTITYAFPVNAFVQQYTALGTLIQKIQCIAGNDSEISAWTGIPIAKLYYENGTPAIFYGLDRAVDNHGNQGIDFLWCITINQTWACLTGASFALDSTVVHEFLEMMNVVSPQTMTIEHGTTGNVVSWWVDDEDSFMNKSYTIYVNGTSNATGTWSPDTLITLNVDNVSAGSYNYTLVAKDCRSYGVNSTIIVNILPVITYIGLVTPPKNVQLATTTAINYNVYYVVVILVAGSIMIFLLFRYNGKDEHEHERGRKK